MPKIDVPERIGRPDDLFELLVEAHRGLDVGESLKLNAKLVLILANHVGNIAIVAQAVAAARKGRGAIQRDLASLHISLCEEGGQ